MNTFSALIWAIATGAWLMSFLPLTKHHIHEIAAGRNLTISQGRWMLAGIAMLSFLMMIAPASREAIEDAGRAPQAIHTPTEQQMLDARLALCLAASTEYRTVLAGGPHKDAIVLANQYLVGEKAGGAAISREWSEYKDGRWRESDCAALSRSEGFTKATPEIRSICRRARSERSSKLTEINGRQSKSLQRVFGDLTRPAVVRLGQRAGSISAHQ